MLLVIVALLVVLVVDKSGSAKHAVARPAATFGPIPLTYSATQDSEFLNQIRLYAIVDDGLSALNSDALIEDGHTLCNDLNAGTDYAAALGFAQGSGVPANAASDFGSAALRYLCPGQ